MFVKQKLIFTHLNSTTNLPINDGRLIAAFLTMIVWGEITDFLSISLMKKAIAAVILILYCFLKNYFLNRFSVLQIIKFSFKIFDWQVLIFVSCFLSQLQFRSNGSFLKFFQRFGSKRLTLEAFKKNSFQNCLPGILAFFKIWVYFYRLRMWFSGDIATAISTVQKESKGRVRPKFREFEVSIGI